MASAHATMEAARVADAYGCALGDTIEQAGAEQAYIQAILKGPTTGVEIPRMFWPTDWIRKGHRRLVVRLLRALYGHPNSGCLWEERCDELVKQVGYEPVEGWPGCYWHPRLKLLLVVYVDDFKLSGPTEQVRKGWKVLRKKINMGDPAPVDLYLGCRQEIHSASMGDGSTVRYMSYSMRDFLVQCVDVYLSSNRPPKEAIGSGEDHSWPRIRLAALNVRRRNPGNRT